MKWIALALVVVAVAVVVAAKMIADSNHHPCPHTSANPFGVGRC